MALWLGLLSPLVIQLNFGIPVDLALIPVLNSPVTLQVELPVSGWRMAPNLALGSDFPLTAWASLLTLAGHLLSNLTASQQVRV